MLRSLVFESKTNHKYQYHNLWLPPDCFNKTLWSSWLPSIQEAFNQDSPGWWSYWKHQQFSMNIKDSWMRRGSLRRMWKETRDIFLAFPSHVNILDRASTFLSPSHKIKHTKLIFKLLATHFRNNITPGREGWATTERGRPINSQRKSLSKFM